MNAGRIGTAILAATAGLVLLSFVVTFGRVPTPWPDAQLYASIARSLQIDGHGVPSTIWYSPAAVDHLPFYGPVFFTLMAASFDLLGFSIATSKLTGLVGVLLAATGTALLANALSGERTRWILAIALVLLTPEVGAAATSGDMEALVLGFELMALAIYVRGLLGPAHQLRLGAAAGGLALLAALTTPRALPFAAAFAGIGCVALFSRSRSKALKLWATAVGVLVAGFAAWTVDAHGSPLLWAENMRHILTREDTDVAIVGTASRVLAFNWSSSVTPAAAAVGLVLAGWTLARRFRSRIDRHVVAAGFALATTALAALVIVWGMNITFSLGVYFAVPVFAVLVALPLPFFNVPTGALAAIVSVLIAMDLGIAGVRWARAAATWDARDPAPLAEFIRRHVPPGASVVGPDALYFFPVEENGAHYRSFSPASHADWARWATHLEAFMPPADRYPLAAGSPRFLIWQAGNDLPDGYSCAQRLASHQAPPLHSTGLGLGAGWDIGFPSTDLYRLSPDCPVGYDPTGTRAQ